MPPCLLVDAPSLPVYDLGLDHPFARDRQKPLFDLLARAGLVQPGELLRPRAATFDDLELAHDPAYIEAVLRLSEADPPAEVVLDAPRFGLGTTDNPIARGQHKAAAAVVGATVACVEAVMDGRAQHAFNPAGGLHHALPAAASGFCIYNDLVAGIRRARGLGAARVLYVDFDVHHGDGVELAFRDDPSVLTLSFHETPEVRWPYTGRITDLGEEPARGTSVNVPLASHTGDASWLQAVERVLVPLARRFGPDLIVSQHGCDPHWSDPLAELDLTVAPMHRAAEITRALAREVCQGRWVATGGGGYQPVFVIPRAWAGVWAVMADRPLPPHLDAAWIQTWQPRCPLALPATLLDPAYEDVRAEAAAARNRDTVDRLLALLSSCIPRPASLL